MGHPDLTVRQAVVGVLNSIGHPEMEGEMANRLLSPDPERRIGAVIGMKERSGSAIVSSLQWAAASDADVRVARARRFWTRWRNKKKEINMAKILIIDDSALSRRILRTIMESAGHDVLGAEDGISGLESYFLEKPDLVTLDLTMKGMYGLDVLNRLREIDPRANVLIASADIQSSTHLLVKNAGAAGFVIKPFVAEAVLEKIAAALKGSTP